MKIRTSIMAVLLLMPFITRADTTRASMAANGLTVSAYAETLNDIKSTLGSVPDFFKDFPQEALPGAWQNFKAVQLRSDSAIPSRYKELIGVAIAGQVPCHYCAFFHTDAAKLNGASDREIKEAVALAAVERNWSTIINGFQTDLSTFKADTDKFIAKAKQDAKNTAPSETTALDTRPMPNADETYKEIKTTMNILPDFITRYPKSGISGTWAELKALSFNPNTAIPGKYKDLISLAVSAQVPCPACIYFDTETAKLDGATEDEIGEAIALAGISRHWSTVLNGMQTNDAKFKKQMTAVFAHVKKMSKANTAQTMAKG